MRTVPVRLTDTLCTAHGANNDDKRTGGRTSRNSSTGSTSTSTTSGAAAIHCMGDRQTQRRGSEGGRGRRGRPSELQHVAVVRDAALGNARRRKKGNGHGDKRRACRRRELPQPRQHGRASSRRQVLVDNAQDAPGS